MGGFGVGGLVGWLVWLEGWFGWLAGHSTSGV